MLVALNGDAITSPSKQNLAKYPPKNLVCFRFREDRRSVIESKSVNSGIAKFTPSEAETPSETVVPGEEVVSADVERRVLFRRMPGRMPPERVGTPSEFDWTLFVPFNMSILGKSQLSRVLFSISNQCGCFSLVFGGAVHLRD